MHVLLEVLAMNKKQIFETLREAVDLAMAKDCVDRNQLIDRASATMDQLLESDNEVEREKITTAFKNDLRDRDKIKIERIMKMILESVES